MIPTLVLLVLAGYVAALLVLWRFQERVVFQPPRHGGGERVAAERLDYESADGTRLFAYLVGDRTNGGPVILAFHGNADLARRLVPWAIATSQRTGARVVLAEYRGYDGLAGNPTYLTAAADARAALACARATLGATQDKFVYFGHSLGSAIAAELAAEIPPRSLVLQSPFSSARAMAKRMIMPGLSGLWRAISRVHYDTLARVRSLAVPVWVAHGDRDLVVPVRMGREVFAAAARPGELLIVHGADHNNVDIVGGDAYWRWLRRAIGET